MILRKGSRGEVVKTAQKQLAELGHDPGRPDGIYGRKTAEAVADFQDAHYVSGVCDDATLAALKGAVHAFADVMEKRLFKRPHGLIEIQDTFGHIRYEEASGGYVTITNAWAEEHIIRADLPVVGRQLVHKAMVPLFEGVFRDLKAKGIRDEIKQFGCWSPRHKMHDPKRSLSTHTWAIACDINQATNMPGKIGDMHPEIVDTFEKFGFNWGGRWRWRDDMHFQMSSGY